MYKNLDIRAKLILTILLSIVVFFIENTLYLIALPIALFLISIYMFSFKQAMSNIKLIVWVLFIMVLLSPLQLRDGDALLVIKGTLILTKQGLDTTLVLMSRFTFISLIFTFLALSSNSSDIIQAFLFFKLPYSFGLVLSLALRFIPTFSVLYMQVKNSQSLRERDSVNKHLVATVISTLVIAIKNITTTAEALELRGYGRTPRSCYKKLKSVKLIFKQLVFCVIFPLIILMGDKI